MQVEALERIVHDATETGLLAELKATTMLILDYLARYGLNSAAANISLLLEAFNS